MEKKKEGMGRRQYDSEFRSDVLKMILSGRSVVEVAASLGIRENLIYKWKSRSSGSSASQASSTNHPVTPSVSIADYDSIKNRLREVEQERDILKKALGIFSRGI